MSAEHIFEEDPRDPQVILRDLPERERAEFLRQYREAVAAASEPAGYRRLQQVLHVWSLTVIASNQPGYYEELDGVRAGSGPAVPAEQVVPGWSERLAAARARQR